MANVTYELTWLVALLRDFNVTSITLVTLHSDNKSALHNASNPIFHERTKHIDIDCHLVRDKIISSLIKPSYVHTKSQFADLFTKALPAH